MKIGNKGITLVELIVSFAIVGVAMLYFFQTLTTVSNLYETSKKETSEFIEKDYYLRILDAYLDENGIKYCTSNSTNPDTNPDEKCPTIADGNKKISIPAIGEKKIGKSWNGNILVFEIEIDNNKIYRLHKYVPPALIKKDGSGI